MTFVEACCDNSSLLLVATVNLSLCRVYFDPFQRCAHTGEDHAGECGAPVGFLPTGGRDGQGCWHQAMLQDNRTRLFSF